MSVFGLFNLFLNLGFVWLELYYRASCQNIALFYFPERNNMFGDDSRLSHLIKRITKESERDRRMTAAQQFEEFLNSPDNYQVTKIIDN